MDARLREPSDRDRYRDRHRFFGVSGSIVVVVSGATAERLSLSSSTVFREPLNDDYDHDNEHEKAAPWPSFSGLTGESMSPRRRNQTLWAPARA